MDPTRFDALTRRFAQPLTRRRVTAALAALAVARAGPSMPAAADTCIPGPDVDCCGPNICDKHIGYCADPGIGLCCLTGQKLCTGGNRGPYCCLNEYTCCPQGGCCQPQTTCCGPTGHPLTCCDNQSFCADQDSATCCPLGQVYVAGCGCKVPCPGGKGFDITHCVCQDCSPGQETCNGFCVLTCPAGQHRNFTTCACVCDTPCGDQCCPAGKTCSTDDGNGGVCCDPGDGCGTACKSDPSVLCCKGKGGRFACVQGVHTCCPAGKQGGPSCCLQGTQSCTQGKCGPKRKHHHH
jgi:hypothetical protein